MTVSTTLQPRAARLAIGRILLAAAAALLAAPVMLKVARRSWATEQGQYGVVVLALGALLLQRAWPRLAAEAEPAGWASLAPAALACSALLLAGRVADEYLLEAYALYGVTVVLLVGWAGWRAVGRNAFPVAYLLLALPLPFAVIWPMSSGLRLGVSEGVARLLSAFGAAVARDGLSLYVGSSRIDIEQACSGMNSLVSLTAVGLAYLHLRRPRAGAYLLLMLGPMIAAAVLANFVRVLSLVLLVQAMGEGVLATFTHEAAGFVTFATALSAIVLLDAAVGPRPTRTGP